MMTSISPSFAGKSRCIGNTDKSKPPIIYTCRHPADQIAQALLFKLQHAKLSTPGLGKEANIACIYCAEKRTEAERRRYIREKLSNMISLRDKIRPKNECLTLMLILRDIYMQIKKEPTKQLMCLMHGWSKTATLTCCNGTGPTFNAMLDIIQHEYDDAARKYVEVVAASYRNGTLYTSSIQIHRSFYQLNSCIETVGKQLRQDVQRIITYSDIGQLRSKVHDLRLAVVNFSAWISGPAQTNEMKARNMVMKEQGKPKEVVTNPVVKALEETPDMCLSLMVETQKLKKVCCTVNTSNYVKMLPMIINTVQAVELAAMMTQGLHEGKGYPWSRYL